jgi:hypothetical protein
MDALDGNAIAGTLADVFGTEMTTAVGTCGTCGRTGPLAEVSVYLEGPGVVVRCRSCDNVLVVIVRRRDVSCVDLTGLASLAVAG